MIIKELTFSVLNNGDSITNEGALGVIDLVLGEHLGSGVFRNTYVYHPHSEYVIKVSKSVESAVHNITEYVNYMSLSDELKPYFAEICSISKNGHVLTQKRASLDNPKTVVKAKLPNITDLHRKNIGFINGKAVIIDYGFTVNTSSLELKMYEIHRDYIKLIEEKVDVQTK